MHNQHHSDNVHGEEIRHHDVAYDHSDLGARGIYAVLIAFAVFGVLVHVIIWGFMRYLGDFRLVKTPGAPVNIARPVVLPTGDPMLRFPTPVLQPNGVADLEMANKGWHETTTTYGWVNEQAGVARIPISSAIDLVAQRGLPTRPNAALPSTASFGSAPLIGGGYRSPQADNGQPSNQQPNVPQQPGPNNGPVQQSPAPQGRH